MFFFQHRNRFVNRKMITEPSFDRLYVQMASLLPEKYIDGIVGKS